MMIIMIYVVVAMRFLDKEINKLQYFLTVPLFVMLDFL